MPDKGGAGSGIARPGSIVSIPPSVASRSSRSESIDG
jgi:hypothetical protein